MAVSPLRPRSHCELHNGMQSEPICSASIGNHSLSFSFPGFACRTGRISCSTTEARISISSPHLGHFNKVVGLLKLVHEIRIRSSQCGQMMLSSINPFHLVILPYNAFSAFLLRPWAFFALVFSSTVRDSPFQFRSLTTSVPVTLSL